jgi:hypothetical protein
MHMNDRKPVIIAVAVGGLALVANGAAAMIALSATAAPPQAAVFGITGLTAAFIGLIVTIVWAFRDEPKQPSIRHQRVFTPWSEQEDNFAPMAEPASTRSSLALARVPLPAMAASPAVSEGRVVYIAEWLKARGVEHANA